MACLLALVFVLLSVSGGLGFDCEFPDRDCGWSWSKGWSLLTAENTSALGETAPEADSVNNVKGQLLYYSADVSGLQQLLKVTSPQFAPNTLPTCAIQFSMHMYQMDYTKFKLVIKAPNSTWESTTFEGNSAHRWENQTLPINVVTQPFHVIMEILGPAEAKPSHVAIDGIRTITCYHTRKATTDCGPRQFQCLDLLCIDAVQVCDLNPDCLDGEDEDQECDKIPDSAYCTFELDMCGWKTSTEDSSMWKRRNGTVSNARTGPTIDHTFQNSTGVYLVTRFPSGRRFGVKTTLTSPFFMPPPYYHRNVHSAYYNSCQIRFFYHKFGNSVGELRVFSLEKDSNSDSPKIVDLWRSYGNKGDRWFQAAVPLPNITNAYQLQFMASRAYMNSDIAIDDVTLSPECFGIGVPENETVQPPEAFASTPKPKIVLVKKYMFNSCGARGRVGPNELMCAATYQNSTTKVDVLTDPTLEGIQKWLVPETGLYTMFVRGAGGGQGAENLGNSFGTSLRATFEWSEGDGVYILIGQKGINACDNQYCDGRVMKRSIDILKQYTKQQREGGGGGGGGGTYIFRIDPITQQRFPVVIAGGGGGLSARVALDEMFVNIIPHGLTQNNSILPINGYTGSGAGGGGGWDDSTSTPTSGESLREGGRGGYVCKVSTNYITNGGFGGGGGGCQSGGGGGGYRGGDASEVESPFYNGQGGTSFLMAGAIRPLVDPGSNPGDGSLVIVPAQKGCGCSYLCVITDLDNMGYYCICPNHLTLSVDGYSCNGHSGVSISPKMLVVIILSIVVFVSILIICIFIATAKYRKFKRARDVSNEPLNSPDEQLNRLRNIGGMVSENNPNYEFGGYTCTEQDLKKIPRENLALLNPLGQGAFGEVYEGTMKLSDNSTVPVAVKTLPELCSNQQILDFLMEALIMSKFNHPNIVGFIGVCFEKMPRYIVLELLPGRDLKAFLRESRPKPNQPSLLTVCDLLNIAIDVAKGCQYLEENRFIHRDIAARNCLLTSKGPERVVKIADFGMARDIYRADYYRKGGKATVPVKWMPPEAFLDGIFTSKTDVWSFGVLLWEVMSLGYMPYPGRCNTEVMTIIASGGRLEPPTNCPAPIYGIMMQCWHPHPDQRPCFITLIERLGYCLQDPDVTNICLPIFNRAPSMERDTTIMRPVETDNARCLQVSRPESSALLSPGSEDYLIPTQNSSYSLSTDVLSNSSRNSGDQLLEMEERGSTPSARPTVLETNFMSPDTPTSPKWSEQKSPKPENSKAGYKKVPTDDPQPTANAYPKAIQNGDVVSARKSAASRMKSLDQLPDAPPNPLDNHSSKKPAGLRNKANLSLDPRALVNQMGEPSPRYISDSVAVDVNCNTGRGNGGLSNQSRGPYDAFAGVNPVV